MKKLIATAMLLLATACSTAPLTEQQKADAWASGLCISYRLQGKDAATYASQRMTTEVSAMPQTGESLPDAVKAHGNEIARSRGCIN